MFKPLCVSIHTIIKKVTKYNKFPMPPASGNPRWPRARARVGFLVAPHHYCGQKAQDIPTTSDWHQHSPAKALLAGFSSKSISFCNPAPSAISSVAEPAASYYSNVPLIFGCGVVHRYKALLHRVCSLREYRCAFVAVLSNSQLVLCCKV